MSKKLIITCYCSLFLELRKDNKPITLTIVKDENHNLKSLEF